MMNGLVYMRHEHMGIWIWSHILDSQIQAQRLFLKKNKKTRVSHQAYLVIVAWSIESRTEAL